MSTENETRNWTGLALCGVGSALLYALIWWLSPQFAFETDQLERPLRLVLALFGFAFVLHLVAVWCGLKLKRQPKLTYVIIGFALLFRALLIGSEPIQEVDIYRYVWDGAVSNAGVSPFEFAPQNVLTAIDADSNSDELNKLISLRDQSQSLRTILDRVHFAHLPTVYPPVSQLVFAAAAYTTPSDSSAATRLVIMKAWLLVFDIGTMLTLALVLRHSGVHTAWLLTYAWCPLVMKEFANSGHLDSIAVFLCSVAVWLCCLAFYPKTDPTSQDDQTTSGGRRQLALTLLASVFLALGVGAKLYPVALVPLLAITATFKLGLPRTALVAIVFSVVAAICLAPLFAAKERTTHVTGDEPGNHVVQPDPIDEMAPNFPPPLPTEPQLEMQAAPAVDSDRKAGFKAFLTQWMMNDFIFLNVAENLTPNKLRFEGAPEPWFVIVPNTIRSSLVETVASKFELEPSQVPFYIARIATAACFATIAIAFAFIAARRENVSDWLQFVFLTMAWFWLLLPTLNPWYWVWALPWIAFARNRVWLALSGLLFVYYLRFYFASHFEGQRVVSFSPYEGASFFDFVFVWFEYVPWFICLAVWHFRNRIAKASESIPPARSLHG